jgi:hypothetical protein
MEVEAIGWRIPGGRIKRQEETGGGNEEREIRGELKGTENKKDKGEGLHKGVKERRTRGKKGREMIILMRKER